MFFIRKKGDRLSRVYYFIFVGVLLGIILLAGCSEYVVLRSPTQCVDSDGGSNITLPGITRSTKAGQEKVLRDTCVADPTLIQEAFCSVTDVAASGVLSCSGVCKQVTFADMTAAACVPAHCVNGLRDDNENGIDCDNDCITACPSACGNNAVETGEICDDGNDDDTDGCTASCQTARCGDGFVHARVEECDDGNAIETDSCTNACKKSVCGDSLVQLKEECDDGNRDELDGCTNLCTLADCGDGIVAGLEQCDDENEVNDDTCTNSCRLPTCSDDISNQDEFGIDCGGSCAACENSAHFILSVRAYPNGKLFSVPCESGYRLGKTEDTFSCTLEKTLAPGLYHVAVIPKVITEATKAWSVDKIVISGEERVCGVGSCDVLMQVTADTSLITAVLKKPAVVAEPSCFDSDVGTDSLNAFGFVRIVKDNSLVEFADKCITIDTKKKLLERTCEGDITQECDCVNGACR